MIIKDLYTCAIAISQQASSTLPPAELYSHTTTTIKTYAFDRLYSEYIHINIDGERLYASVTHSPQVHTAAQQAS
jgi:hypothetical protein